MSVNITVEPGTQLLKWEAKGEGTAGLLFSRLNSTSLFLLCSNSHQQHTSYCELGVVSRGLRISTATRAEDSHHSSKEEERTAQRLRGVPVATGLAGSWGQDPHFVHLKSLLFSTTTNFLTKISTSKGMIIKSAHLHRRPLNYACQWETQGAGGQAKPERLIHLCCFESVPHPDRAGSPPWESYSLG